MCPEISVSQCQGRGKHKCLAILFSNGGAGTASLIPPFPPSFFLYTGESTGCKSGVCSIRVPLGGLRLALLHFLNSSVPKTACVCLSRGRGVGGADCQSMSSFFKYTQAHTTDTDKHTHLERKSPFTQNAHPQAATCQSAYLGNLLKTS